MSIDEYNAGTAIRIDVEVKTYAGALTDPDSIVVTITDPEDTIKFDEAVMDSDTKGIYYYIFQSGEAYVHGIYEIKIKAVAGGKTSLIKDNLFMLI